MTGYFTNPVLKKLRHCGKCKTECNNWTHESIFYSKQHIENIATGFRTGGSQQTKNEPVFFLKWDIFSVWTFFYVVFYVLLWKCCFIRFANHKTTFVYSAHSGHIFGIQAVYSNLFQLIYCYGQQTFQAPVVYLQSCHMSSSGHFSHCLRTQFYFASLMVILVWQVAGCWFDSSLRH